MNVTIVYYTNCLAPKTLLNRTLEMAMKTALDNDWNLVVSSHFPMLTESLDCGVDFHHLRCQSPDRRNVKYLNTWNAYPSLVPVGKAKNYVTGILTYSFEAILTQITHAISTVPETDIVLLWEHDVIYPDGYAESMVKAIGDHDYVVYEDYVFLDDEGFFKPGMDFWYLSRYAARKEAIMSCFETKIELENYDILEPILEGLVCPEGDYDSDNYTKVSGPPVIDVKHGANASGQILVDNHDSSCDAWGDAKPYIDLIMDKDYIEYVTSRPEVGYGLFVSGQSFFL